ncbi:MAG: hydrogenase [Ignavibacteriales bacterium UTCHB2]|jgi:NADH-quinone oxidoreductase subunit G/[NiFe] hydrogenase diaphorase moiety small subunit|nr:MAG: NADP-reducing hydrogenase subunit HndC [Ignavibacteria bacterium ADurb.Bin266]OQY74209.1 MAG: hydrogenase [Ignavibacteriales bacterium UTCHB2]HQI39824.1 NADH-dependent [FeFe] hydrogenase, group A6 [Ignavibacteriaceae bacterium]HQJ46109.1 NADH-dependent [FeFe] hydrogenase, group A6 [Ignavibacteriaceae bacterium]
MKEKLRAPKAQQPLIVEKPTLEDGIGSKVTVEINEKKVQVLFGQTILEACKENQIHVPTLCHHPDLCIAGNCRICVVEVEGMRTLQTACSFPITAPIKIKTSSPMVRKARRHIIDLLLSEHYGECYSCVRNNNCELQTLAKEYGVDSYTFGHVQEPVYEVDLSSYSVVRDMNKCVNCRRCVRTCIDLQEVGVLEAIGRGDKTHIGTFLEKPLADVICINCGQCINRCPTGALRANDPSDVIWNAIDDPTKHVVIQTAPSPRAAIGEVFGLEPGKSFTGELNTALRRIGFDVVFDTNFTADLTIIEEGTELILRLYKALVKKEQVALPQFTSCSPGWVKYLEHFYPEYIDNLSSAKSPQQMFGALIKTFYAQKKGIDPKDIVSVALMPCAAKKFECNRPEMVDSGYKDVDFGLTTRELGQMIQEAGIYLPEMPKSNFDDPFGEASGAGLIFGATGGVMEAALRSVIELVTGKKVEDVFANADITPVRGFEGIKYAEIPITEVGPVPKLLQHLVPDWNWLKGATLKIAVAHGTANAKKIMDDIKAGGKFSECHFIEFMACPGGCLGGGGQPIPTDEEIRKMRAKAIYDEDNSLPVRKSHENRHVAEIYDVFLTDGPCGHISHKLLHTHYIKRGKYIA